MREHVVLPNLVTSVSMTAGFLALATAAAHPWITLLLVALAGVLDGVDGALARRRGGDHTFGAQLDSLTDLLCFCVVPAYALMQSAESSRPGVATLAALSFLLAGAWRLARFPLVQQSGHFVGVPTPAAGGLLVLLLALPAPAWAAVACAPVLAVLMVSSLRVPTVLAAAASVRQDGPRRGVRRVGRALRPTLPQVLHRSPRPGRRRRVRPSGARPDEDRGRRVLRGLRGRR